AAHLIAEVAAALGYAHALADEAGRPLEIVHRDVSPSKIMLGRDGQVKMVDFGIARVAARLRGEGTRTGELQSTLENHAPEQIEGGAFDGRSDLFALGVVAHECLTLRRVLRGKTELETLRLIRRAEVEAPSQLAAGIGPELDAVVLRLLARLPAERFGS